MAYIGKTPVLGNFVKLDSITVVNGQAAYTMQNGGVNFTSYDNVNQFLVSLNGVLQAPTDSFTVSGSTLTFASNLSTGDVIDFVLVLGNSLDIGTPSDNTISTAKLQANAVTNAKLNNDIISGATELASEPADTDEFLVSDAGTLKRIDYSLIKGGGITEADMWRLTTDITANESPISNNLERVDNASFAKIGTGMSVSSGVWTFPSTGLYQVGFTAQIACTTGDTVVAELDVSQDNGSNWDTVVYGTHGGSGVTGDNGSNINMSSFVNVTDTSNVKVRFNAGSISSGSRFQANTNLNLTTFYFIRLGDSQ